MTVKPLLCTAALLLAGCNLAPTHQTPPLPVPPAVSAQGEPAQADESALRETQAMQWLQSPALREVVALALTHNRDLRVALENIEKARAQYGISRADLLPGVNAQAQANRARTAADLNASGNATLATQYTAQLGFASYELDLWGRVRNLNEAALQQFLQSQENQRNVRIGLVADVANAWLTLAADQARLQLARDTLASRAKALELTRRMHQLGAVSGLVLAQNQTTVDTARGDVASTTAQVERDRNVLQLLAGGPVPQHLLPTAQTLGLQESADVAALTPVPVPLPSTVLLRRPDVQAAEQNLVAANANVGVARAAYFPAISLTGALGLQSDELDDLFDAGLSKAWSFSPNLAAPIFNGGKIRANVRVAEAKRKQALADYEKSIQTAFREVADALAGVQYLRRQLAADEETLQAETRRLDLSQLRYEGGVDSYSDVLDAQRYQFNAELTAVQTRNDLLNAVVQLYKALGGGWQAPAAASETAAPAAKSQSP